MLASTLRRLWVASGTRKLAFQRNGRELNNRFQRLFRYADSFSIKKMPQLRTFSMRSFIQQQETFSPPSYIPKDPPLVDTQTQQAIAQYKQGLITPSKLARVLMSQKLFYLLTKDSDHSQVFLLPSKAFVTAENEQKTESGEDDTFMFLCFSHKDLLFHFWNEYIVRDNVNAPYTPGVLEATPFSIIDNVLKLPKISKFLIDPGAKHMASYKVNQLNFLKEALEKLLVEDILQFLHSYSEHSINPQKSEVQPKNDKERDLFFSRSLFMLKNDYFFILLKTNRDITSTDINNTFFLWKNDFIPLWSSLDLLEDFKVSFRTFHSLPYSDTMHVLILCDESRRLVSHNDCPHLLFAP